MSQRTNIHLYLITKNMALISNLILTHLAIFFALSWAALTQIVPLGSLPGQCYTVLDPSLALVTQSTSTKTTSTPLLGSAALTSSPTYSTKVTLPTKLPIIPKEPIQLKYIEYLQKQKPNYKPYLGSSEYTYRELVYNKNKKNINDHNSNTKNTFVKGINRFADMQEAEFLSMYAKLIVPASLLQQRSRIIQTRVDNTSTKNTTPVVSGTSTGSGAPSSTQLRSEPILGAPNLAGIVMSNMNQKALAAATSSFVQTAPPSISIDWSCKASPVINQGQCGTCYIISALQSVFMTLRIYNKTLLPLSIQQVLSCAPTLPNMIGCVGGYFDAVYRYMQNNGVGRAIMYPYDSKAFNQGIVSTCNTALLANSTYKAAKTKIASSVFIPNGDCASMVEALKLRVVAVSIAVEGFQFYDSGIFTTGSSIPNHGVTLVGYDPTNQYKVKNSWGTTWGMSGYAYVSQETGVCDYAMYPITGSESQPMGACCT